MGIILFIVSLVLTIPLFIVNVILAPIYDLITLKWLSGVKNLNKWFKDLAVSVDQFGNGSCYRTLNATLIKKNGSKFGNIDETVSFVLGVNQLNGTLTKFGKFIVAILNILEKNHCSKAVIHQKENDLKSVERLKSDLYNGVK